MTSYIITAAIGVFGGIMSGLLGVGGGTVFVPLLMFLRHFNTHQAIGTSLAIVIPTAMIGVLAHHKAGNVDWRAAAIVALCAIIGAWFGAKLSLRLDAVLLNRIFAVFLLIIAFKMFFSK